MRGYLPILEDIHAGGSAQTRHLLRVELRRDGVDDRKVALDLAMHPEHARARGDRSRRLHDVELRCGIGRRRRGAECEGQDQNPERVAGAHRSALVGGCCLGAFSMDVTPVAVEPAAGDRPAVVTSVT